MKRKILASILGVSATMAMISAYAQGKVNLDNYAHTGAQITYGGGANAVPGAFAGQGIHNGVNGTVGNITWTIGFYYGLGDITASVGSDPSGFGTTSFTGLTFATGVIGDTTTANLGLGYFATPFGDAIIDDYTSGLVTFEVVAFSGADYGSSLYRGHSAAFTLTPATGNNLSPDISSLGAGMPTFSVFSVPEPSAFALAGLGAAVLLGFYRKK